MLYVDLIVRLIKKIYGWHVIIGLEIATRDFLINHPPQILLGAKLNTNEIKKNHKVISCGKAVVNYQFIL